MAGQSPYPKVSYDLQCIVSRQFACNIQCTHNIHSIHARGTTLFGLWPLILYSIKLSNDQIIPWRLQWMECLLGGIPLQGQKHHKNHKRPNSILEVSHFTTGLLNAVLLSFYFLLGISQGEYLTYVYMCVLFCV